MPTKKTTSQTEESHEKKGKKGGRVLWLELPLGLLQVLPWELPQLWHYLIKQSRKSWRCYGYC